MRLRRTESGQILLELRRTQAYETVHVGGLGERETKGLQRHGGRCRPFAYENRAFASGRRVFYNLGLTSESAIIIMKYKQINGGDEIYCVKPFALAVGGRIGWKGMGRPSVAR